MVKGPSPADPRSRDPADPATEQVGRSTQGFGRALYWSYVMSGGRIAISLGVSLLLARLLGPEAFGLIAIANVYIYFMDLLVRQGMPAALIQRPELDRRHLDTAFWMVIGLVGVLLSSSIALSGWWARVNSLPELQAVIVGLSPVLALRSLSIVQESQLLRKLDFRPLALRTNIALVIGGITGVGLALAGAGVWALVGQQIVMSLVEVIVLWSVSSWRPAFRFDRGRARELLSFSGLSSLAGIGVFLQNKVDALLIGLMFGPVAVGLYRMAMRLTSQVVEVASGALQSVSLPELSRHADDPAALNHRIGELVRLSALMSVPALGVLALLAEPLLAVLGEEWLPAVQTVWILCVAAVIQVPAALTGPVLQAAGKPGLFAAVTWIASIVSGGSFVAVGLLLANQPLATQLAGLAVSRVGALVLLIGALVLPLLWRSLRLRPREIGAAVLPVSGAVIFAVLASAAVLRILGVADLGTAVMRLGMTALVGALLIGLATLAVEPLSRTLLRRVCTAFTDQLRPARSMSDTAK